MTDLNDVLNVDSKPAEEDKEAKPSAETPVQPQDEKTAEPTELETLRKENEELKSRIETSEKPAKEPVQQPSYEKEEDQAVLRVQLNRNEVLLGEDKETVGKVQTLLQQNPYAVWGTKEEMQKQVEALKELGSTKSEEAPAPEVEAPTGVNPVTTTPTGEKALADISTDEAWQTPLDELEKSISSDPSVINIGKS